MRILSKLSRILLSVHYFCTKKQQTRSHSYTNSTHALFLIHICKQLYTLTDKNILAHTPIDKKRKQCRLQCIYTVAHQSSVIVQPSPLKRSTFSHHIHYRTTHPHSMCNAYLLQHEQNERWVFSFT